MIKFYAPILLALQLLFPVISDAATTPAPVAPVAPVAAAPAPQVSDITDKQLIDYLDQLIIWYRQVSTIDVPTANSHQSLIHENIKDSADKSLHLGFDFAKAETALLPAGKATTPSSDQANNTQNNIMKANADNTKHIADLQQQLKDNAIAMHKASRKEMPALQATRDAISGQIDLAKAQQDLLQNISGFLKDTDNDNSGGLLGQINNLEHSVLEPQSANTAPAPASATAHTFTTEPDGILALITEIFTLSRQKRQLYSLEEKTSELRLQNKKLWASLKFQLHQTIEQGNNIAKTYQSPKPADLTNEKAALTSLVTHFKEISKVVTPLNEEGISIDATKRRLADWQSDIDEQFNKKLQQLTLRLGLLAIAIAIPLVISELFHRATLRYIKDIKRRRQLQIIRRIVVGMVILLVIIFSFSTEFGSLATFAGFITAGIAVALQNVILSAVAYFFFFGRFGVKVGDRVTIGTITGDVVEIGLIRIYLMELGGSNIDLYPTGRIVAFSNSILFQPSAFCKQVPDTYYSWHEISLDLPQGTNYPLAQTKLLEAVESVYNTYKETMVRQQTAMEHSTHLKIEVPRPDGRLKLSGTSIALVIRYPVALRRATEIDDNIIKKLFETIANEPQLAGIIPVTPKE